MRTPVRYCAPAPCATAGCGDMAVPGAIHCHDHRLAKRRGRRLVEPRGPTEGHELDIEVLIGQCVETHPCAYQDCGQPALMGRLYCSGRCRARARTSPAEFTIEGVTATIREHAQDRGLDLGTVYCRMKEGASVEAALTRPLDDEMQRRRFSSGAAA